MKSSEPILENMTFEEAFAELEKIVQILETSNATLADSIAYYEKGQRLSKYCSDLLKDADLKLQILQDGPGNSNARSTT
jgi:exodeoxyribonuclease VII small subunit